MCSGFVYLFKVDGFDVYKIGNSKHPKKRLKEVQTGCPFKVTICHTFETDRSEEVESYLHRRFDRQKETDEGHELQGEFFCLTVGDTRMFLEHCKKAEDVILLLENTNTYVQEKKGL